MAGQNMRLVDFSNEQVMHSEEHALLTRPCETELNDEETVEVFYRCVIAYIESLGAALSVEERHAAPNYLILLLHDGYDVPARDVNGVIDHNRSENAFHYVLCTVCPVQQSMPALRYFAAESESHSRESDWVISPPDLEFLLPAFEKRGMISTARCSTRAIPPTCTTRSRPAHSAWSLSFPLASRRKPSRQSWRNPVR